MELIFQENAKKYIQSKLITNKKTTNYMHYIGSQTDYREESTQTDPFSPTYTISGGEHPEVFALSDFTYGKGLPVTSVEISFIERLRARREWEKDHTIDMTRTKIIIEREIRQWQIREKEIKMLQDTHLKLFTKNLHTYIKTDQDLTHNIIDLFIYRQEKQLKSQYERLEIETSRDIRRMKRVYRLREAQINAVTGYNHLGVIGINQRGNGCFTSLKPPWHKRPDDIITTFKNTTSKIYTPCSNLNYLFDRHIHQSRIDIFKLEELLPKNALIAEIDEPDRLMIFKNNHNKKASHHIRDLEKAHQRHDHRRIAIIKLQNYLRGIIVQSKVLIVVFFSPFEISFLLYLLISTVRQIRQHLLDELRNGLKYDQISSFNITNDNYRKALASPRTQLYDYLEGATIADMFDFLSKELLRLQSEQIIHLFVLLADRYRYQREATETACRTKSIERQMLENHALQEMFSLDSNSDIKSYLEDLILESISNTANEQAKLEIKQITETLVNLTDEINNSLSNQSDIEMIVSQLVHQILFPTVQKILSQDKYKNFHMSIKLPSINT
ncbi:unnamed protein product [Rotaria sp. Silwood1]|nr:unnamed protein product [Rotaria sp. Silwood1]